MSDPTTSTERELPLRTPRRDAPRALGSAPRTELEVAIAPQVSGESWLNEDAWRWLRDLYEYAATQTRAIPTLAKLTPEEFCWALYSALHGKPGLMEVAVGSAPRGTPEERA